MKHINTYNQFLNEANQYALNIKFYHRTKVDSSDMKNTIFDKGFIIGPRAWFGPGVYGTLTLRATTNYYYA